MEIKKWQIGLFLGSIAVFVIYVKRNVIGQTLTKFGNAVSTYASKWVGVKEIGNNQAFGSKVFQQMLDTVGWNSYDQWCMYFAKAVHYDVFKDNPTEQAKINKILNGNTQSSYTNAKNDKTGTYTVSVTPKVGDIIIFQSTINNTKGHAGVVTGVNKNNTVNTIEGNTSDKSIADGDLVAQKVRPSTIGADIGGLRVRGYIRKLNV
jgi:surface antigen